MKRYIVTEAELKNLCLQERLIADEEHPNTWDLSRAWDACTARPVPEWATMLAKEYNAEEDLYDWNEGLASVTDRPTRFESIP